MITRYSTEKLQIVAALAAWSRQMTKTGKKRAPINPSGHTEGMKKTQNRIKAFATESYYSKTKISPE